MKVVIVGGGTAGWLTALMMCKVQKGSHDITVVDSSKIGIIGAGEGSTGYLTDIIQGNTWDYGCNEIDFLKETGATVKLGIEHKDWKQVGHSYIAPIDGTFSATQSPDVILCHALLNDIPFHTVSQNGFLIETNKTGYFHNEDGVLENSKAHGYHFDGHKVGKYLKKISMAEGVKHIDTEVLDVILDEDGIKSIKLANETELEADFFVDCSGFARKLISALDVNWTSYSKNLPVNSAMPFLINYKEDEVVKPVTTAWAQKAGWMWKIPTGDRYGCGYVYDNNFISDEEAKLEIESVLGHEVTPIKWIKFDTGRLDKLWHKNCLAIGLSAAFAEPLEATSIHSQIVQLTTFIFDYMKDTKEQTVNNGSQNIYNRRMTTMYDDFKDFLVLHYQTQRKDSEFWRWVSSGATRTPFVEDILDLVKSKMPQSQDFRSFYGYAGAPLWNWILAGLGFINKHTAEKEFKFYGDNVEFRELQYKLYVDDMNARTATMIENSEFIRKFSR